MTKRKYKTTKPPRAGTFAAFVVSQPAELMPAEVAALARAAGWPNAKAQGVSSTRQYYQIHPKRVAIGGGGGGVPTTSTVSAARRAPAMVPADVPVEVATVIARFGTDAVRRALAYTEARAAHVANEASAGGL